MGEVARAVRLPGGAGLPCAKRRVGTKSDGLCPRLRHFFALTTKSSAVEAVKMCPERIEAYYVVPNLHIACIAAELCSGLSYVGGWHWVKTKKGSRVQVST